MKQLLSILLLAFGLFFTCSCHNDRNSGNKEEIILKEPASSKPIQMWIDAHANFSRFAKNEIITSTGGVGPLYSRWIEFRSMTITQLITDIRTKIKSINPQMELHFWSSAHWKSRYSVGQNWASKDYTPVSSDIYTETCHKTGFADQIDVFSLGAYAENVWKSENPQSDWSVENFVTSYSNYTKGACKVYGSIGTYAYEDRSSAISDAVYLCLKNTKGLMVFDISHVINHNQWNAIREGIKRAN